jgi:ABC-2 type transport system ATP-binding protein
MNHDHIPPAGDNGANGAAPAAPADAPSAATGTPVLVAEGLRKMYDGREALKSLTFSLNAGRVLGFLGPNGAGKTTSIRILTTIMEPTAGHFTVDGIPWSEPERIRARIGVLPESLGFPKQSTAFEYLTLFGRLYGRTAADSKETALALLDAVGLKQRARSAIGTYSRGMRQRLGIARSLVNDPAVVFFDEPTLGLDPRGQQELLTLVRRVARERNTGVILCSHALAEIESICDDVVILSAGEVVASGTVASVIGRTRQEVVQHTGIRIKVAPEAAAAAQQQLSTLPHVTDVTATDEDGGWLRVELTNVLEDGTAGADVDYRATNDILAALIHAGVPILSFQAEGGGLQDAFLHLTEGITAGTNAASSAEVNK